MTNCTRRKSCFGDVFKQSGYLVHNSQLFPIGRIAIVILIVNCGTGGTSDDGTDVGSGGGTGAGGAGVVGEDGTRTGAVGID